MRTGNTDRTLALPRPDGVLLDFLSHKQTMYVQAWSAGARADTVLAVFFPSVPGAGRIQLDDWHPTLIETAGNFYHDLRTPIAFLLIEEFPIREVVPLKGWVELEVEQRVPGPGSSKGLLESRLVAAGSSFRQNRQHNWEQPESGAWTPTGRRYDIVMDLRPAYVHYPVGTSAGQVSGLPVPATWTMRETWWRYDGYDARAYHLNVEDGPPYLSVHMPSARSTDLGPIERTDRAYLQLYGFHGEESYSGVGTTGRVEITRYVPPPSHDLYGEIQGRVVASGRAESWSSGGGAEFQTTFDFHSPVFPQSSISQSPTASEILRTLLTGLDRLRNEGNSSAPKNIGGSKP